MNKMKNLKLVFHEKKTIERNDGSPVSMTFTGNWDNNSTLPEITLRITKCDEDSSMEILEDLGIEAPGEAIFLMKGKNPQVRLDEFLVKAEKRRTPQIENFVKEIEDFDAEMIGDRYDQVIETLDKMIAEDQTETKRFDFYFECFKVLYERRVSYPFEIGKEQYITNHTIEKAINQPDESDEDESRPIYSEEEDDEEFEEE